jgi:hypothetical protein
MGRIDDDVLQGCQRFVWRFADDGRIGYVQHMTILWF